MQIKWPQRCMFYGTYLSRSIDEPSATEWPMNYIQNTNAGRDRNGQAIIDLMDLFSIGSLFEVGGQTV